MATDLPENQELPQDQDPDDSVARADRQTISKLRRGCSKTVQTPEKFGVPAHVLSRALRLRTSSTLTCRVMGSAMGAFDILEINGIVGSRRFLINPM